MSAMTPAMLSQLQPRRSIKIAAVVVGVLAGIYLAISVVSSDFRGSANMEVMAKEYAAIAPPPDARQLGEIRASSKWIVQSISADFTVQSTVADVEQYYNRVLSSGGWKRARVEGKAEPGKRVTRFCKGELDLVLDIPDSNATPLRYYFGVRWEGGPHYKSGCPSS